MSNPSSKYKVLRAQPGPQTKFLSSSADVIVFGGGAGGGKTFAVLLDILRYSQDPNFTAVVFRRTSPMITSPGSIWQTSKEMFRQRGIDADPLEGKLTMRFPNGGVVKYTHMEHESDKLSHAGAQYTGIYFDEGQHFCLTEDHEVLTTSGWKTITEVNTGEEVYTLNDDKTLSKEICEYVEFDFDDTLYEVDQRNGISIKATKDHRMVIQRNDKDKSLGVKRLHSFKNDFVYRVSDNTSEDTFSEYRMPEYTGRGVGSNTNTIDTVNIKHWSKFLGWYISEGNCVLGKKSDAGKYTGGFVFIRQIKGDHKEDIRETLDNLGYRWSENEGGFYIYSTQLVNYLSPLGNTYTKRVPNWLFEQSKATIREFLDGFEKGDGHVTKTGAVYIGLANRGLRDDLQHLYFLEGRIGTSRDGKDHTKKYDVYSLCVSKATRTVTQVPPTAFKEVHHKGKVYCLICPKNKNFYVRRKGRCYWSGNTESQVQFMFSRMRSDAESSSYMRITCNPDPDCYLREWIDWWLDKDGFPDKSKGGVIRWFVIRNNIMEWGATPQELAERLQEPDILAHNEALSFTYIPSLATDNPAMVKNNPKYISFLKGLPRIERAALLEGNWNVKLEAGTYFNRSWVDNTSRQWPTNLRMDTLVRYWDRAATAVSEAHKDPDWTVGVLMGRDGSNNYWVLDVQRMRGRPYDVKKFIKQTAVEDGHHVTQILEQDPGAAGKSEVDDTSNMLIVSGYACRARKVNKDKLTRFKPFSAASEQGRVHVVKKSWNEAFFSELENFTGERDDRVHDDQVDAISGAFSEINTGFQTPSGLRLGTVKNTNLFSNFNL